MKSAQNWRTRLATETVPALLVAPNQAIGYFARRDLLDERPGPVVFTWGLPEPQKLLLRQRRDGFWEKAGKKTGIYPP
jgi:hypothetical protein